MVHSFLFVPASLARGGVLELSERREAQERGKWRVVKSRMIVSLSSPVCLERSIDKPDSSAQYCKRSIYSNIHKRYGSVMDTYTGERLRASHAHGRVSIRFLF